MVWVEICPEKPKNMIFAVMYKPPSMNQEKFILGLEQDFLAKLDNASTGQRYLGWACPFDGFSPRRVGHIVCYSFGV